jgi:hypothetical protein
MNGLFGSAILDTAVGLIFIYLLLAVFCTTVNEWISGIFSSRAKYLQQGIKQLLQDPSGAASLLQNFYAHPVIASLMDGQSHPSYIPARSFSRVIMDLVTPKVPGTLDFKALDDGINDLPPGRVKTTLLALIQDAHRDLPTAQQNIEAWYDDAMERVSGWFKRHTQIVTVVVALLITVATNADTLYMAQRLWADPGMRSKLVEQAKTLNPNGGTPPTAAEISTEESQLVGSVIGWGHPPSDTGAWLQALLGWIITTVAVSLGAPFWFDALNKFMNIRNSGKSPNEEAKIPEKPTLPPVNP